jgi:hypothetical protein
MEGQEGPSLIPVEEGANVIAGAADKVVIQPEKPIAVEMLEIAAKEFVEEVIPDDLKPKNLAEQKQASQPVSPIIIEDGSKLEAIRSELKMLNLAPVEQPGQIMNNLP